MVLLTHGGNSACSVNAELKTSKFTKVVNCQKLLFTVSQLAQIPLNTNHDFYYELHQHYMQ